MVRKSTGAGTLLSRTPVQNFVKNCQADTKITDGQAKKYKKEQLLIKPKIKKANRVVLQFTESDEN